MISRHARDVLMLGIGALIQPVIAVAFALRYRRCLVDRTQRR